MAGSTDARLHWSSPGLSRTALLLVALIAAGPTALLAGEETAFKEAVKNGRVWIDLRYRFENVSDDSADEDAHASTLRTVLGYRTQFYKGFSFQVEAENVTVIGNDLYDNLGSGGANNRIQRRSAVADPAITELNQALLRYQGDRWRVAAGRQELVLGDARFIGNVGWRQNHQSFDALRLDNDSLGGLRLTYAYLHRVNRITGDSWDLAGHLANLGFELQNVGKFTLYGYLVDWQRRSVARLSTATYGLEFAGRRRLGSGRRALLYEVEYAEQADHADNPRSIDAGYTSLMLGLSLPAVDVKLGRETLEGGIDGQFQAILGTLHDFNGWADKFPTTPFFGLQDTYLELAGETGPVAWLVRYHEFEAEARSLSYGEELDLRLVYTCPKGVLVGLKGALYDADAFSFDTDKWMIWASYDL